MSGPLQVDDDVTVLGGLHVGEYVTNAVFYGDGRGLTNIPHVVVEETDPVWSAASNAVWTAIGDTNVWATADWATNSVRRSGDAMTGALALPAGGLTVGGTQLVVLANGFVGIGMANPTNALAVNGTIKARELVVSVEGWPDYVFAPDYDLMPLEELDGYIRDHRHLPGIPPAEDVERGGVRVGDLQARLLRKIEELTLYVVELSRQNAELRERLGLAPDRPSTRE
jgi:hypothetical protein